MNAKAVFALVGLAAFAAGAGLWGLKRPPAPPVPTAPAPITIAPGALYAASFTGADGRPQSLGQFQGEVLVLNFWATWCGPCREEMPAFDRVHARWRGKGARIVGISAEDAGKVAAFSRDLGIGYPLWTGGDEVGELSRRLGNAVGVLPHTAIIGTSGQVLETRVGPYTERQLEERLQRFVAK